MSNKELLLSDISTDIEDLKNFDILNISSSLKSKIENCRKYLDQKMTSSNDLIYGINTGFGFLQNVRIDNESLETLQSNLIKSHACGLGERVPDEIVKLMLALKVKSLSYGNSGVQLKTVERLIAMHNNKVYPVIYTQGSLGASGDLAPLSHLCLPLLGEGKVSFESKEYDSGEILNRFNWEPISLQSKEGLALINGTQFMSAYGIYILQKAERLFKWANIISALSFDAYDCVPDPLNENIHKVRPHQGQLLVAAELRRLLSGSEIISSKKKQVQDPYSFRCIPQVHGASYDTIQYVKAIFFTEINSVTDNPNIFPEQELIISGGNFHGQPLALGLDFLSIALSELSSISERRTYQLISGLRDLPPFLVSSPGLNSGFMIPQYTAAGIVSENKQLCTPASVDSIPSSNNQEDHVSMGANAATKCKRIVDNLEKVLAIELLNAAQALDFRRPLKTSPFLEEVYLNFREYVSFNDSDRILHDDMLKAISFLQNNFKFN